MMIGFYGVIAHGNFVKKIMGLGIFQVSVLLLYISISNAKDSAVPILVANASAYVNPLPHVLMLTAIVVGIAVMAVGLALVVRINEEYGTVEEEIIFELDTKTNILERRSDDRK